MPTKSQTGLYEVLGSKISSSFTELKGHEHVANGVTVGIVFRTFGAIQQ